MSPFSSTVATLRYFLTCFKWRALRDGLVPWVKWAKAPLISGQFCWAAFQAFLFKNGSWALPAMMSDTVTALTTESFVCCTNLQISQELSSHCWGCWELNSLDGLAVPAMWQTITLYELRQDRNVDTRAEAEKCPWHRRLYANTHGFESVKTWRGYSDSRAYVAKFFTPAVMASASSSQGSQPF